MVTSSVARVGRGLALEPDLARPPGIEHDETDGDPLVLVGGVAPRVVELVEDVRPDPARAPLAIPGFGSPGDLDRHVVRVDLGRDTIEQDPALAPDRRRDRRPASGKQPRGDRLDDRATDLAADLVATIGDLERDRQDRLRGRQPIGRHGRAEQAREHPAP